MSKMKLNVIIMGKSVYLGNIDTENYNITDAMSVDYETIENKDLIKWVKTKNVGELEIIKFSTARSYTMKPLEESKQKVFSILLDIMEEAKNKSVRYTENSIFSKLCDKYLKEK